MQYYYKYKKYKLKYLQLKRSTRLVGGNKLNNRLSFNEIKSGLLGFDNLSYYLF